MIIKFKTRTGKQAIYSSKQLCSYILKNKDRDAQLYDETTFFQNMDYIDSKIHKSFLENFQYIKKGFRANGIALNHTVISIHPKDREHVDTAMINSLRSTFIEMAGISDTVLLSKAHRAEQDQNIHLHLLYSHNNYRSKTRVRLSKSAMKSLLIKFEEAHILKYPQLQYSIVHTLEKNRTKNYELTDIAKEEKNTRKEKEYQVRRRYELEGKGRKTKKERVAILAKALFEKVDNLDDFIALLRQKKDIQIYSLRDQIRGLIIDNTKYRFSTIDLSIDKERIKKLSIHQARLKKLKLIREMAKSREDRGRGRGL